MTCNIRHINGHRGFGKGELDWDAQRFILSFVIPYSRWFSDTVILHFTWYEGLLWLE